MGGDRASQDTPLQPPKPPYCAPPPSLSHPALSPTPSATRFARRHPQYGLPPPPTPTSHSLPRYFLEYTIFTLVSIALICSVTMIMITSMVPFNRDNIQSMHDNFWGEAGVCNMTATALLPLPPDNTNLTLPWVLVPTSATGTWDRRIFAAEDNNFRPVLYYLASAALRLPHYIIVVTFRSTETNFYKSCVPLMLFDCVVTMLLLRMGDSAFYSESFGQVLMLGSLTQLLGFVLPYLFMRHVGKTAKDESFHKRFIGVYFTRLLCGTLFVLGTRWYFQSTFFFRLVIRCAAVPVIKMLILHIECWYVRERRAPLLSPPTHPAPHSPFFCAGTSWTSLN